MKWILSLIFFAFCAIAFSQTQFIAKELNAPKDNWNSILAPFTINETERYDTASSVPNIHKCIIPNNLRSSTYQFEERWLQLKDTVTVRKISIVFSKYPIRKSGYKMNQPLLANRLINLFDLDASLNSDAFDWEIMLQTDCKNDKEATALFHGAIIHYTLNSLIDSAIIMDLADDSAEEEVIDQNSKLERQATLKNIKEDAGLSKEELEKFEKLPKHKQEEFLRDLYEESAAAETDDHVVDSAYLEKQKSGINTFIETYGSNRFTSDADIVPTVLDRHPEWKNILIIADWTGSMYGHGAKVLEWHAKNYKRSEINYFTLFNDGDHRIKKKVGNTRGIYSEKADNMENLLALYRLVMMRGGGGDGPENDLEAVIKGMETFPDYEDIILIADNNACVRDIALLQFINHPIHVIVCGYNEMFGVNPQYLEIAYRTGGTLHTIETDIEAMSMSEKRGRITLEKDRKLVIGNMGCPGSWTDKAVMGETHFTNLKKAKKSKPAVESIDVHNQKIKHIPSSLARMPYLNELNLSDNSISRIPNKFYKATMLSHIDLSNNDIKKISKKIRGLRYLNYVNLNSNKIEEIPAALFRIPLLHTLLLSDNNIEFLPRISKQKQLKILDLSYNKIKTIPYSIKYLKNLEELYLSNNELEELPNDITRLRYLKILDLSNNQLKELPRKMYALRSLEQLNLSNNPLTEKIRNNLESRLPNVEIIW